MEPIFPGLKLFFIIEISKNRKEYIKCVYIFARFRHTVIVYHNFFIPINKKNGIVLFEKNRFMCKFQHEK